MDRGISNVQIIGVCGRKRHGKDSVGQILSRYCGYTPLALADPIKKIAMEVYHLNYAQVFGDEKEEVDPYWGTTPRRILQHLGTEMGRAIHPDTWIRKAFTTIVEAGLGLNPSIHCADTKGFVPFNQLPNPNSQKWVLTDIRFLNEVAAIQKASGVVVKVIRPDLTDQNDTHQSETEVDLLSSDITIYNSGSLVDLEFTVADEVIRRLGETCNA